MLPSAFFFALSALSVSSGVIAATTTKPCIPTLLAHPSPKLICGDKGILSKPYDLEPSSKVASLEACERRCLSIVGCVSFGYTSAGVCQPLGKTVRSQDIQKSSGPRAQAFYNHRCFSSCPYVFPTASTTTTTGVPTDTSTPVPTVSAQAVPYNKRATVQNIAAANKQQVLYGATDPDSNVLYFIVDLVSNSKSPPLVSLESFIPFVTSATCTSSLITLQFNSSAAYKVATSWPSSFFLITTGSQYCGTSDGDRTYYKVTKPTFSAAHDTVKLPVRRSSFKAAQSGFSIEFGTQATTKAQSTMSRSSSSEVKKPKAFVPEMADAIRSYLQDSKHTKRATNQNVPFVYPLSPDSFQFTDANPQTGDQYGAGPIEFNCESGTCGFTADISVGGSADCTTGQCTPEMFTVDVNYHNPSINALYRTSFNDGGSNTATVNYAADLASIIFYRIIVNPIAEFDFTATLEQTFIANIQGPFEIGGVGYNAANFSSFNINYDEPGNPNPVAMDFSFSPVYNASSPFASGEDPSYVSIAQSTGPRIGVNFLPATGDPDLPNPHYQAISLGGPALQLTLERIQGKGAPQCTSYYYGGPPVFLDTVTASFTFQGTVNDVRDTQTNPLFDSLGSVSQPLHNAQCVF